VLPYAAYTWKARAFTGGAWKAFSAAKAFTISNFSGFNSQFNGSAAGWLKRPGGAWAVNSTYYYTAGMADMISKRILQRKLQQLHLYSQGETGRLTLAMAIQAGWLCRGAPTFDSDNDWLNAYEFVYSNMATSVYGKGVGGSWTALQGWTTSASIVPKRLE